MAALSAAFGFLTVVGRGAAPDARAAGWFGVVGATVGLAVGGAWWGASELWPVAVAATLAMAVDLVVTGALHVDGLADTGDGLLPHADRERRLEIMRMSDVGAFGLAVVAVVLIARVVALGSMEPEVTLVVALWATSRACAAVALVTLPYARAEGIASSFMGRDRLLVVGAATVSVGATAVLAGLVVGVAGWVSVPAAALAGGAVLWLAMRRIGGFTGDVLGAAIVVAETVGLIVASARW